MMPEQLARPDLVMSAGAGVPGSTRPRRVRLLLTLNLVDGQKYLRVPAGTVMELPEFESLLWIAAGWAAPD